MFRLGHLLKELHYFWNCSSRVRKILRAISATKIYYNKNNSFSFLHYITNTGKRKVVFETPLIFPNSLDIKFTPGEI